MKKLLISSTFNLCDKNGANNSEYIKRGAAFYREHGFDAAEFDTKLLDLTTDAWREEVETAIAASEQMGTLFYGSHLPFLGGGGVKDDAYMEQFDKQMHNAIDAMAALGVKYAVLHPNAPTVLMKNFDRRAQYDTVMRHLSPYVEHANRVGLPVVVENMRIIHGMRHSHRYCQTPEELCEIADALGIGICWDFGHANISGVKQSEGLAYIGSRLKAVHVNDNSGIDDDHVVPFAGNVDWRDAMHGLALAGYTGTLNFEIATGRIPENLRGSFADYLADIARELMTYIE